MKVHTAVSGRGDVQGNLAISPTGDCCGCHCTTTDRKDDQENDKQSSSSVLTALAPLRSEGAHHFLEGAGRMTGSLPGVVRLSEGVPARHRNASKAALPEGLHHAVQPDAETAAEDGQDDDQIAELEHHVAPLRRQSFRAHRNHREDGQVDPGEPAARHDEPAPDDESGPATDDLAFREKAPGRVGVPEANPEVEDEKQQQ